MIDSSKREKKFWRVFGRVLGCDLHPGNKTVADLKAWDSLRHVELVFELEETFDLDLSPDDIVALYSNTNTILAYIEAHIDG